LPSRCIGRTAPGSSRTEKQVRPGLLNELKRWAAMVPTSRRLSFVAIPGNRNPSSASLAGMKLPVAVRAQRRRVILCSDAGPFWFQCLGSLRLDQQHDAGERLAANAAPSPSQLPVDPPWPAKAVQHVKPRKAASGDYQRAPSTLPLRNAGSFRSNKPRRVQARFPRAAARAAVGKQRGCRRRPRRRLGRFHALRKCQRAEDDDRSDDQEIRAPG